MDSPLLSSPLLNLAGAVPAEGRDTGVAAHYGDPYAEQRALDLAAGLVDRSNRGVLRITGPDRLSWLHSLTTQHLEQLGPGGAAEALILSPHGHVEHHLTLTDDGAATWVHVEPGTAADAAGVPGVDAVHAPGGGRRCQRRVRRAHAAWPGRRRPAAGCGGSSHPGSVRYRCSRRPRTGSKPQRPELREQGLALAGMRAYEALRIAAHRPRLGLDTDHRTIPHEVGWIESAVHLDKGCYRGQETVARVHNLGHPPRRLVFLHLDGSEDRLPGHGDPVELDGAAVGFVGSAARHYELGPIGAGAGQADRPGGCHAAGRRRAGRAGGHGAAGRRGRTSRSPSKRQAWAAALRTGGADRAAPDAAGRVGQ